MLDVHPPHRPTHTWKDFFIHIATIVVGLFIAVGLEQVVEYFHHREQAHRLEESLNREIDRNLVIYGDEKVLMERVHQVEEQNKASLNSALSSNGKIAFAYIDFDPILTWHAPTNETWAQARDNGTLSLLPESRASYYSNVNFSYETTIAVSHQLFDARYHVLALVHLHPSPAQFIPSEERDLLLAISTYEQTADHAHAVISKSEITLHLNGQR